MCISWLKFNEGKIILDLIDDIEKINELSKEFVDCKMIAVHLSKHSLAEIKNYDLTYAKQGESIII